MEDVPRLECSVKNVVDVCSGSFRWLQRHGFARVDLEGAHSTDVDVASVTGV